MTDGVTKADRAFDLWFFRVLSDAQRKALFGLTYGAGVAEEANTHGLQRHVLKRVKRDIGQQAIAQHEGGREDEPLNGLARDEFPNGPAALAGGISPLPYDGETYGDGQPARLDSPALCREQVDDLNVVGPEILSDIPEDAEPGACEHAASPEKAGHISCPENADAQQVLCSTKNVARPAALVEGEVEALRQRAATAEHRLHSFRQAHAARGEQLRQFIKDRAPELWPDYAAVSVNSSIYSEDYTLEPVFDREINILRHRAEDAERRVTEAEARITQQAEEVARLREALKAADDAIREMFRYYDGGETRGSYDGKPERAQLRKAGYATRAALRAHAKETGDG